MLTRAGAFAVVASLLTSAAATGQEANPEKARRTAWFHEAGWGVFTHYLSDIALPGREATPEEWNKVVNAFDAEGLAAQLDAVGARYFVITLGQNSGYYLSPNATYDKYVGHSPSRCSNRDLVADLAKCLKPRGIRLMVYLPSGAPDKDPQAMDRLGWRSGNYPIWSHPQGGPANGDDRLVEFQRKWEEVITEWSKRWGEEVSGWWFDGCYFPFAMYKHDDAPNFATFAAAARAGNPNSIVAFNPGVFDPIFSLTEEEDYTAGEINDAFKAECPGRWIGGAQAHMLSYLGPMWAQRPPRYTDGQVVAITRRFIEKGGVVTWDVPIQPDGLIPQEFATQLSALNASLNDPPTARGSRLNPHVLQGLDVTPVAGMTLKVAPGIIDVDGIAVEVIQETLLTLEPARLVHVRDEEARLTEEEPKGYGRGTPLRGCQSVGSSIEGCLVPESLVVKADKGPGAARFVEGVDWRADKAWGRVGRLAGGAIGPDTPVFLDYDYSLMRLDTIAVRSDGSVILRAGSEHRMCPQAPHPDMAARPLCNVYVPYHTTELTSDLVYPIGPAFIEDTDAERQAKAALLPKSIEKLAQGGPFTIVFWGDSVTCGGDTSTPEAAFPQSFTAWLRNRYPQASISYVNAGTGGWNSDTKLPLFEKEVIEHQPDLVVIEFVNDMGMTRDHLFKNYTEAVERIRQIGGEVIIITPHFVRPDWMGGAGLRTHEPRAAVVYLKEFAAMNRVAVADASRRWEHLWQEGIPYMTLLYNAINHPDDRGHGIFVEELRKCFP